MPDFRQRSSETELMDEADIAFGEFHDCLKSLEIINHLTLAYRPTLRWLQPKLQNDEPLNILDAGSGGGDMLRQVARKAENMQMNKKNLSLIGVDLNAWSKRSAQTFSAPRSIRYETGDIFEFEPETPVDIIICSLFTHHLTDSQLVDFLRWIDTRARRGWFINDLHRHPVPYYFIKAATRLFSRNRLIRNDAAVSVARSFQRKDWHRLLGRAGITEGVQIRRYFPFRLCLACDKH